MAKGTSTQSHTQDFYELILIRGGNVRQEVSGAVQDLAVGDLVFIRPVDRHALHAVSPQATVMIVAVHPDVIASIGARHQELKGRFFWSDQVLPDHIPAALAEECDIGSLIDDLDYSSCTMLATEAFLLQLCARLLELFPRDLPPLARGAPDWLVFACAATRNPKVFREGPAGFALAAGHSHPHVCRTLQRYLGMTPSVFVNLHRMKHAARRLVSTDDIIREIARDCGIPNLSHFHRVFLNHHGVTPLQYRRLHHRNLIRPDPDPLHR
jgi:AraC family transcriptional regulator, dual regulator of chb operon